MHSHEEKHTPLSRQIRALLSLSVAISRPCRYHSPKKHEKHLDASKNPPTFASSKQNNRFFMTIQKRYY